MFSLETALVSYWSKRKLTEEEFMQQDDFGRTVLRIGAGLAVFALLIASLGWAADDHRAQQQLAESGQAKVAMEAK